MHARTHANIHTHTHTHTHTRWFLWFLSIGVMVFILYKLYVLLPYTYPTPKLSPHRRLHFYFPPKNSLCMIYKHFELWEHWKCPHKSPSPCNTCHTHVIIQISVLINHINTHTHTHTHTHTLTFALVFWKFWIRNRPKLMKILTTIILFYFELIFILEIYVLIISSSIIAK